MGENRSKSDGFMLRFPDGLRARVKLAAEANGRSMNAEIIRVLEEAFPAPSEIDDLFTLFEGAVNAVPAVERPTRQRELLKMLSDMLLEAQKQKLE